MTADQLMAHFEENWTIYAGVLAVLSPVLYFGRKWTVPVLLWTFESIVYAVLFHIFMHYLVAIVNWFKFESQMKMLVDDKVDAGWQTPLVEFWRPELYNPGWIIYLEGVAALLMVALVLKMRPMKTQKIKPKPVKRPGQPGYIAQQQHQQRAGQGGRGPGSPRK